MQSPNIGITLGEHVTDVIAVFDADGGLCYLNRIGRRLLRVDVTASERTAITDLAATAERERLTSILAIVDTDGAWTGPIEMQSPVTGDFPTRSTICQVDLADGATGIAWIAKDTSTDREVIRTLRERAFYDQLTGLPHRTLFLDRLDLLLRRVGSEDASVCVVLVSPDRLKERVSRLDQGSGDSLIRLVAQRLTEVLGNEANLHRWGDEDFVVLHEQVGAGGRAKDLATAVSLAFDAPFAVSGRDIYLTASIGVTTGQPGAVSTDGLLRQAEEASRLARGRGGDSVQFFDAGLRATAERAAAVEDALRHAIDRDELHLHYQPEVSLRTGQIVGCEALVRWRSPTLGDVSPGEFIPVAESANLITSIGSWVLESALTQASAWQSQSDGWRELVVSVNISAHQFAAPDFVAKVRERLTAGGTDPTSICLEITESALLDDAEETVEKLVSLKRLGVKLAIDDFGTGYSSLSYLRRFPIDILKVDQTFVNGLGHDPEDSAIVQAVIHMGQALGMTTVAEGVETDHHVIELRELQCDIAQGYLYARPMPASEFTALLAKGDDWR